MKVLVTGANGYLGMGIVEQLLNDGITVVATDFSTERVDSRADSIDVDLFSVDNPYCYFGYPDVVLHLAWRDGFKHNSENHLKDLNNHYLFLSRLMKSGIKRVAVLGSMHEVGFYEGCINESTPCNPQSLYGISKNALRQAVMLEAQNNHVAVQWIRGYYIVGNTGTGCSIFSKIVQAENEGKKDFPFTIGLNQYDFIDYDRFCEQTAAIVEQVEVEGIIENCLGAPMKLGDRVESFIRENDFNINLQYGAYPDRPYDSKAVWGDQRKIVSVMAQRNLRNARERTHD